MWYEKNVPLRELQEVWTYEDVMKASAVLDMYSAVETAREAFDKSEMEQERKNMERNAKRY